MTSGTVRDIRTGRAIAKTNSLTHTFIAHVERLTEGDEDFYLVYGRCRHREVHDLVKKLRDMDFTVIYDAQMPSDCLYIFEGQPEELGFAS